MRQLVSHSVGRSGLHNSTISGLAHQNRAESSPSSVNVSKQTGWSGSSGFSAMLLKSLTSGSARAGLSAFLPSLTALVVSATVVPAFSGRII